jgi:hypothetical protein
VTLNARRRGHRHKRAHTNLGSLDFGKLDMTPDDTQLSATFRSWNNMRWSLTSSRP